MARQFGDFKIKIRRGKDLTNFEYPEKYSLLKIGLNVLLNPLLSSGNGTREKCKRSERQKKIKTSENEAQKSSFNKKEPVLSAKQFALRRALREEVSSKTLESRLVRPRARTRCRTENKRCIIKMPCFPLFSREKKSFE